MQTLQPGYPVNRELHGVGAGHRAREEEMVRGEEWRAEGAGELSSQGACLGEGEARGRTDAMSLNASSPHEALPPRPKSEQLLLTCNGTQLSEELRVLIIQVLMKTRINSCSRPGSPQRKPPRRGYRGHGPDRTRAVAAVWGAPAPAVGLWGDALAGDRQRGGNLRGAAVHKLRRSECTTWAVNVTMWG